MITTLFESQTFASLPNSRLNTPMVPGPHTSWVISTSTFTQTLSPAATCALPLARARIFSVSVIIRTGTIHALKEGGKWNVGGRKGRTFDVQLPTFNAPIQRHPATRVLVRCAP